MIDLEKRDPELAKMMRVARDLDARALAGGWPQMLNWAPNDQGGAIVPKNTYTTIADICNPQSKFIGANTLKVGTVLNIHVWGTIGSAAGTATTTMGLYLNGAATGTQMCISATATPATSTVNVWHLDAWAQVLTIGTSGTIQTTGIITGIGATAATAIILPATLPSAAALNTEQANNITVAASWGTSAAGNTYSVYGFQVVQYN